MDGNSPGNPGGIAPDMDARPGSPKPTGLRWRRWATGLGVLVLLAIVAPLFWTEDENTIEARVEQALERTRRDERNERGIYAAAEALLELPEPLSRLGYWIRDEDPDEDWEDVDEKLRALGDEAGPVILRLLEHDRSPAVRAALCWAVTTFPEIDPLPVLTNLLSSDPEDSVRYAAVPAVAYYDTEPAASALLSALTQEPEDYVAVAVIANLPNLGAGRALEPLLRELEAPKDGKIERQRAAAEALGGLGDVRALPALRAAWETTDQELFSTIAIALAEMQDTESLPRLIEWIEAKLTATRSNRDGSPFSAAQVDSREIAALANFRDPRVFAVLTNALAVLPDDWQRGRLIDGLGKLGDPRALEPLMTAFDTSSDEWVRRSAIEAIARLDAPGAGAALLGIMTNHPSLIAASAESLANWNAAEVTVRLGELLESPDKRTREAAALVLGLSGAADTLPALLETLAGGDDATRLTAVKALVMVADPRSVPALLPLLTETGGSVAQEAAWALGYIADPVAVPELTEALAHEDFYTRFAAAFALAGIQDSAAVGPLTKLLRDEELHVRIAAACSLSFHGSDAGLDQLRLSLRARSDDWHRFAAIVGLLRLDTPAVRQIIEQAPADKMATLQALRDTGLRDGPTTALVAMLRGNDETYRHYAARILPYFRDPSTVRALRDATRDESAEVRSAARVAIVQIERQTPRR